VTNDIEQNVKANRSKSSIQWIALIESYESKQNSNTAGTYLKRDKDRDNVATQCHETERANLKAFGF
jgi:hypothetical protein